MALGWWLPFGKKYTARSLYLTLAKINSELNIQDIRRKKYRKIFHNFGIQKAFLNITQNPKAVKEKMDKSVSVKTENIHLVKTQNYQTVNPSSHTPGKTDFSK